MHHESELELLLASLKKCRLGASLSEEEATLRGIGGLHGIARPEPRTVYNMTDGYGRRYKYMLLDGERILTVGPYLTSPLSESEILELGERNKVSPKQEKYLRELYDSLPVLDESSPIFAMLNTFLERLWESPSFAIVDRGAPVQSPIGVSLGEDGIDEVLVNMKAMEQRYAFENELMEAVTLGQLHREGMLLSAFSSDVFEQRLADPLRNAKNYGIIMNTLLRKAAERGGVHPMHLDKTSSDFAARIERMSDLGESTLLMCDIFRGYCRLVRKHSMQGYSPIIRKTLLIIDSDLSADLSLSALSRAQGVSGGYLSTLFKQEIGKTLSEYVRERRVKHAAHLLSTTELQIQTVALHCGILDLQYFSKLFKRETGKTPKEYRESAKITVSGQN